MSAILSSVAAWWIHWGPWIGAALIPTIITGLSLSPKTAPEAAWVQKAWDFLKTAMGYLSVVTPKDAPGTFQLPLKLNKVIRKAGPTLPMIVLVAFGGSLVLGLEDGCAWLKSESKKEGKIALDCTKDVVKSHESDLLPVIEAAAGGDSLTDILTGLAKQFGEDVVGCIAIKSENELMAKLPAGGPVDGDTTGLTKVNHLKASIAEKKWEVQ